MIIQSSSGAESKISEMPQFHHGASVIAESDFKSRPGMEEIIKQRIAAPQSVSLKKKHHKMLFKSGLIVNITLNFDTSVKYIHSLLSLTMVYM